MWVFPLAAGAVAFVFAGMLARHFAERRRPFQLLWTLALAMYGVASLAMAGGVLDGWSTLEFQAFWALGAVLNVPFLAAGEIVLLFRTRWVLWAVWLVLVFFTAFTVAVLSGAEIASGALREQLPLGREVFGAGTSAHGLARLGSYPAFAILVAGALWSVWTMRGRPELRNRSAGTLLIAAGATVVAAGSAFAAAGVVAGFSLTLTAGIGVMFWGFVRASRPVGADAAATVSPR